MVKYHFILEKGMACGRSGKVGTDRVSNVTCLNCQKQPEWVEAKAEQDAKRQAEYEAQTPREVKPLFGRVNADGVMECSTEYGGCGGTLWREKPRSLFSYHYVCANCDKSVHPMTETGMCT